MNVKKAIDKLAEWNNVGEKLKQHVPNNDEVLHSWLTQLEEFSQDLPLLLQLSSDALKVINPCRTVCTNMFGSKVKFKSSGAMSHQLLSIIVHVSTTSNKGKTQTTITNKERK